MVLVENKKKKSPATQKLKNSKPAGTDLRTFFSASGSSQEARKTPITTVKKKTDVIEIVDDDDEPAPSKSSSVKRKKAFIVTSDEEEEEVKLSPPKKKLAPTPRSSTAQETSEKPKATPKPKEKEKPVFSKISPAKAKSSPKKNGVSKAPRKSAPKDEDFIDDDTEEDEKPQTKSRTKSKPSEKAPKALEKAPQPSALVQTSSAPADAKKFNWAAAKAAKLAGPSAPGSKPIPDCEPNALQGLAFVFTGELTSLARDEAIDLAKRFGGRVTGQPSSVTNFVVLGDNAGPAKLAAIKKHGLKTLNEDEFLNLIATRQPPMDDKTRAKLEKENKKIREAAMEMEKEEKKAGKATNHAGPPLSSQLWTVRYAPKTLKEICGNKGQVEKLQSWLHDWPNSLKSGFKKPGKNGMNVFRAVLISGPPGIGKTTSAHLVARLEGFVPIELNASDARSKKLVEAGTNISNTSLDGWMHGGKGTNVAGVEITDRSCLIMDEVDGMSAGDRGGVGALNALIKKTKIPIICIANDRGAIKLKPLTATTFSLPYRKPEAAAIRSRILSIAYREKMQIPANVVDQLVAGTQSDIRQVINMMSTWKLSSSSMSFDEGKDLAKANEKYSIMTPFNVINKMLGPYLFSPTSRETLGDKIELYFHDHSFMPLFMQENYLKTEPAKLRHSAGPEKDVMQMNLMEKASASISDGDLVDALIHGPEQHWSLMPLHAVLSTVRPASFLYGSGAGYGGPNAMCFPQWLGQNSKQNKLRRQLGDVQIRMRLKVSGDKPEIRQNYIPALYPRIIKPLIDVGASAVDDVIQEMDEYFLSKEEWDTIVELGLDDRKDEIVLKKISTATKTNFTKKYNSTDHPIAFHKAQEFKIPKKLPGGPAPDLEDVFDLDEDVDEEPEQQDEEESEDVSKDSLIKQAKGQATGKGKAKASKAKSK